jgi:hypothetical protein
MRRVLLNLVLLYIAGSIVYAVGPSALWHGLLDFEKWAWSADMGGGWSVALVHGVTLHYAIGILLYGFIDAAFGSNHPRIPTTEE